MSDLIEFLLTPRDHIIWKDLFRDLDAFGVERSVERSRLLEAIENEIDESVTAPPALTAKECAELALEDAETEGPLIHNPITGRVSFITPCQSVTVSLDCGEVRAYRQCS
jgi:hypothetical protein